ncbi:hypothetical protein [Herbidospora yilanensis]|uniref:hypothetical protein n=1 Tax=Herbidospora yilanensis TaxID=354426 RepID=UPI000AA5A06E|nr:hypothetical protein [Herbidospora yilanensis]
MKKSVKAGLIVFVLAAGALAGLAGPASAVPWSEVIFDLCPENMHWGNGECP